MTREEAKVFMLQFNTDKRLNPSEHEAVRVAIKALEQDSCDCISRQQAIDKMQELENEDIEAYGCSIPEGFDGKRAIEALKALPSIQPTTKENLVVEDCISRAELLKAIDTWDKFGVDDTNSLFRLDNLSLPHYVPYIHYDDVVKAIKGMPSIQPKTDVLDKIRAEIEEQKECRCFDDDDMCIYRTGLDDALYIIDKYKAEKE